MLVKAQPLNAYDPIEVQFDRSPTLVRAEQNWNAPVPIEVQFDKSTLIREEQLLNADSPILVQLDRSTLVRAEQPLKALLSIVLIVEGRITLVMVHSENTSPKPKLVTIYS